ncbi:hypothetical protein LEMLEM_LOCUS1330 [Lemmus lemmus]
MPWSCQRRKMHVASRKLAGRPQASWHIHNWTLPTLGYSLCSSVSHNSLHV